MLEADCLRFYSADLAEEIKDGRLRRLWSLVSGLPPEAAVFRIDGQQWTVRDELLALAAERIDAWGLANARLHTEKKHQKYLPDKSLEVPRPGQRAEQRDEVITDAAEIAAWFG